MTKSNIVWEEPPPRDSGIDQETLTALKAKPGAWARVGVYNDHAAAQTAAQGYRYKGCQASVRTISKGSARSVQLAQPEDVVVHLYVMFPKP